MSMNILDCFKGHSVEPLAEAMTEKPLRDSILNDFEHLNKCQNPKMYALSSYSICKATLADSKVRARFKVNVNTVDPLKLIQLIRTALRSFVLKCVKYCNLALHPELGDKQMRLHFHGYYNGDHIHIDRIVKWWRRNLGFCTYKVMTGEPSNWFTYCDKAPIGRALVLHKALLKGGLGAERKQFSPPESRRIAEATPENVNNK